MCNLSFDMNENLEELIESFPCLQTYMGGVILTLSYNLDYFTESPYGNNNI